MGGDYESGLPRGDASPTEGRGECVCVCSYMCVSLVTLTVGCGGCVYRCGRTS